MKICIVIKEHFFVLVNYIIILPVVGPTFVEKLNIHDDLDDYDFEYGLQLMDQLGPKRAIFELICQ